jgi:DeoR/GlpR family transcriptional regulator of sugar metabolism
MIKAERQREILAALEGDGIVSVAQLSERFGSSTITIRRDLIDLKRQGKLSRTHGGATLVADLHAYARYEGGTFEDRASTNGARKRRIAERAAQLVSDGDSLLINAGSTTTEFARALIDRQNLQVVTNGLTVAFELSKNPSCGVFVLAGTLDRKKMATVSQPGAHDLASIRSPSSFLGVVGLRLPDGPVMLTQQEALMNHAFMEASTEVTLLIDSSKFEAEAMFLASPLERINRIITDEGISSSHKKQLERAGVELIVVPDHANPAHDVT